MPNILKSIFQRQKEQKSPITFDSIKRKHEAQNLTLMPLEEFERNSGITETRDDFPDDLPSHHKTRDYSKIDLQKLRKDNDRRTAAFRKKHFG